MSIVLQGSTSGSVTLQEPAVAGTTVLTLPAVSGTILTTGSSGQSIPKAALPTGSILQVLSSTDSTERATTSTSFTANSNTLSVTITPTSSTSKFFISVSTTGYKNTDSFGAYTIYRNSTNLGNATNGMAQIQPSGYFPVAMSITDSPATASAITYQVYYKMIGGSGNAYLNAGQSGQPTTGGITVMEIAA
jgi:hypothetical protein